MNILLTDHNKTTLECLRVVIRHVCPACRVDCFDSPDAAATHAAGSRVDIAFLGIEMPAMNGLALAQKIKGTQPAANIVFIAASPKYAMEAFHLHASGYLVKPVSDEDIIAELANLRARPMLPGGPRISVHTFGNFEVFYNGAPLPFGRGKAKELLAYLVDRKGAGCTSAELCSVLWENKEYCISLLNQFQTVLADLRKTLRAVGAESVVVKRRNFLSIDPSQLDCDYYRYLSGDSTATSTYTGEYMANYSWAEFTMGYLYWSKKRPPAG